MAQINASFVPLSSLADTHVWGPFMTLLSP
jgi:hypothetical protein